MGREARAPRRPDDVDPVTLWAELDAVYRDLPALACQGKCAGACGLIPWGEREARAIATLAGAAPTFTADLSCSFLTSERRCSVYVNRPLICRMYGLADGMRCPYGCEPARAISKEEAVRLMARVRAIVGRYRPPQPGPDVPAKVVTWVAHFWKRNQWR